MQQTVAQLSRDVDALSDVFEFKTDASALRSAVSQVEEQLWKQTGVQSTPMAASEELRAVTEAVCGDRLAALDMGLARVTAELRSHADTLESVQVQQHAISEDMQGRLGQLISRVNNKCEDVSFHIDGDDLTRSNRSQRSCERGFDPPRLLGNTRSRTPNGQKQGSALLERSRSCGEVGSISTRDDVSCVSAKMDNDSEILHALREENLRLRETNVDIREQAMQKPPPNHPPQQTYQFIAGGSVKVGAPAVVASPQTGLQAPAVLRSPGFAASPPSAVHLQSPVLRVPAHSMRSSLSKSQQALGPPANYHRPAILSNVAMPVTPILSAVVRGRSDGPIIR